MLSGPKPYGSTSSSALLPLFTSPPPNQTTLLTGASSRRKQAHLVVVYRLKGSEVNFSGPFDCSGFDNSGQMDKHRQRDKFQVKRHFNNEQSPWWCSETGGSIKASQSGSKCQKSKCDCDSRLSVLWFIIWFMCLNLTCSCFLFGRRKLAAHVRHVRVQMKMKLILVNMENGVHERQLQFPRRPAGLASLFIQH